MDERYDADVILDVVFDRGLLFEAMSPVGTERWPPTQHFPVAAPARDDGVLGV